MRVSANGGADCDYERQWPHRVVYENLAATFYDKEKQTSKKSRLVGRQSSLSFINGRGDKICIANGDDPRFFCCL